MLPKLIENRKILLQSNEVLSQLGELDLLITEKSINPPLKSMDRVQAVSILTQMSKNILFDIGIKQADPYEIGRFCDVVLRYYKRFSINEIKLAFELLLIGELDQYLPKDRNQQPDKNHYQSFSFEYISKVLRAYSRRRDRTWHKAHKALPVFENKEPTEADRKESRERFVNDIKKAFTLYRDEKEETAVLIPAYWVSFLNKKGFINIEPELDEHLISGILERIKGETKRGEETKNLKQKAQFDYYHGLIYRFFDYLLSKNEDLNKLL